MNILYLSTERGWHGGEEQLRLLIEGARAAGHDCRVAARRDGKFAPRIEASGVAVTPLAGGVSKLTPIWTLRRLLAEFRPHVVHANDPHAVGLMRAATWGLRGIARIASRRVLFSVRSTGKYVHGAQRVICVSHAVAKVCRESGIPAAMIDVVHDGVDPRRMTAGDGQRGRLSLGVDPAAPMLLCVAQMAAYKGHRYLLAAMPRALAEQPDVVLALAGDGPLREELAAQAAALGIARAVKFLGYRTDVPDLIAACDAFVLASPEEGLGTAVLDAMFAGRAVVGANAGGIPEMLRDSAGQPCGWLAAPRDGESLAAAILESLDQPQERQRRVENALLWASAEFTAERMVARTLEVYAAVLATLSSPPQPLNGERPGEG